MRRFGMFWLAVLPLLAAHLMMADDNFAVVGTCKPKLTSFTTIQAAVSKVPPGSTVLVCPGVYPEQVTISQPLTLQGIADSNLDQITITATGGLAPNVTSMAGQSVAAQVLVQNTGPVNLSNIAVDGAGGDQGCTASGGTWLAGVFYSGSSGSVNRVRANGQMDGGCGVGIWAENAGSPNQSVTIQGSSVHDIDNAGIFASSGGPTPTLAVRMKDNFVFVPGAVGMVLNNVSGEITDNDVSNALAGIFDSAPAAHISSNNVTSTSFGVLLLAGGRVQSNDIMNSGIGVFLAARGANVQSNRITLAVTAIEFGCSAATVAQNTINDAASGLDQVPSTFTGTNTFANTGTIRTDCGVAAPRVSSMQAVSQKPTRSGLPPSKWRTPANPLGLRP
jgi:hypothetical protein